METVDMTDLTDSSPADDRIEFMAEVARVQTMADGGLRFIFDVPETATMQAAQLMECKRFGVVLKATLKPEYKPVMKAEGKDDGQQQPGPTISRRAAKRRK